MKTKLYSCFLFLICFGLQAQTNALELNGFHLGQFREVATNELGEVFIQDQYDNGVEYEVYLLHPDRRLYMVFEYYPEVLDEICSIQIAGIDATADLGFKNLKLGMDSKEIIQTLGQPTRKVDVGEYGERWEYEPLNYSVEINPSGRLSSIKITMPQQDDAPDWGQLPDFKSFVKTLSTGSNAEIAALLAPGIEIYQGEELLFFEKSIRTEIKTDVSKVFETIRKLSQGLDSIDTHNEQAFEENMRLMMGMGALYVIKIKNEHPIHEIVFIYWNGRFLIWEIHAR